MSHPWLEEHLETFVRPNLGKIPTVDPKVFEISNWKKKDVMALKATWAEVKKKAKGRPILLPGRDVFLLEVMARLEGFPTTFRPDISSCTPKYVTEDYTKHYCIDTGFRGSVPLGLKCEVWDLIYWTGTGSNLVSEFGRPTGVLTKQRVWPMHQLFPNAAYAGVVRSLYGKMEAAPKYWIRAEWRDGKIFQKVDKSGTNFLRAAVLTMHVVELATGVPYLSKKSLVYTHKDTYFKTTYSGAQSYATI